jgi:hypothetical protein
MLCPIYHKILILIIKCCVYKVTSFYIDPFKWNGAERGAYSLSRPTVVTIWDLKFSQWWVTLLQLKIDTGFKASEWRHGEPSKPVFICQLSWEASRLWAGQSMVHILDVSRPRLGPIQACCLVGSRAFSAGVQWTGCQADHTPPSNTKVNESNQLLGH